MSLWRPGIGIYVTQRHELPSLSPVSIDVRLENHFELFQEPEHMTYKITQPYPQI